MSNDKQELIRRFAVAIVQAEYANPESDMSIRAIWQNAVDLAGAEPQPQPEPQPEHTREDSWELQGDVKRLTKDVQRLSANAETLERRIRRAAALLRGATRYDTAAGFAVTEDRVDEAVQILQEGSDD